MLFGKKSEKIPVDPNPEAVISEPENTPHGKGAPTPKRKEQEAARKRPLVPNDRKLARQAEREAAAEQRQKVRRALDTGDERFLPPRDRGERRRYIRNYVDARTSVGEFFLLLALVVIIASMVPNIQVRVLSTYGFIAILFLILFDGIVLRFQLKKRLEDKFGAIERGDTYYGIMRAMQLRRLRLPKPLVKRGEYPS